MLECWDIRYCEITWECFGSHKKFGACESWVQFISESQALLCIFIHRFKIHDWAMYVSISFHHSSLYFKFLFFEMSSPQHTYCLAIHRTMYIRFFNEREVISPWAKDIRYTAPVENTDQVILPKWVRAKTNITRRCFEKDSPFTKVVSIISILEPGCCYGLVWIRRIWKI